MNAENVKLNSGTAKICYYDSDYAKKAVHTKTLIQDLYGNLPDLDLKVIWIMKVTPLSGYSYSDVIKELIATIDHSNSLIMTQAGILSTMVISGDVRDGLTGISYERKQLYNADFTNILFNRRMSRSYGNPEFFIYVDDISSEFIKNNIGDSEKIISRTESLV